MTEELKTMMTRQADELEPFSPDIDAITGAGRRRLRSRRFGAAGAGVAVVLAVGLGVPQLVGGGSPDDSRDTNVAVTESAPSTWAQGSVIHVGDATVDVGHPVHSFVVTTAGFVSTDPDGKVWSTVDGSTVQVGSQVESYGRQLVADGQSAGWIEFIDGKAARFVFLDQSTGSTVVNTDGTVPGMGPFDSGKKLTAELFALDDDDAYLRDTRGLVRFDIAEGTSTVLAGPGTDLTINDAEQGQVLHFFQGNSGFGSTVSSTDVTDREPTLAVSGGDLSPTGRYVMSENSARNNDDFTLVEVATGTDFTATAKKDYQFFTGYAWVDDTSYMALALTEQGRSARVDLLACEVTTRACEVTVSDLDEKGLALPIGENL
ncbi:hypothetical protein [Nocardioides sp. Root151]|uniref:hypothetical protein n=1 Tax=Nocardioides sp. Root151 TaxID=1736475 RepID=UPI0007029AB2|nr:hypothetical protein [Nocardioides sp. Root151]KQZ70034.1 hypothetical protein ASD66_10155 [Nocardioides sp. Root151]